MFAIYISHPFPVIPKLLGPIQLQLPATIKTTKDNANYLTYFLIARARKSGRSEALTFT